MSTGWVGGRGRSACNFRLPPKASGKDTGCVAGARISKGCRPSRRPRKKVEGKTWMVCTVLCSDQHVGQVTPVAFVPRSSTSLAHSPCCGPGLSETRSRRLNLLLLLLLLLLPLKPFVVVGTAGAGSTLYDVRKVFKREKCPMPLLKPREKGKKQDCSHLLPLLLLSCFSCCCCWKGPAGAGSLLQLCCYAATLLTSTASEKRQDSMAVKDRKVKHLLRKSLTLLPKK